jgi:hypothetical protein
MKKPVSPLMKTLALAFSLSLCGGYVSFTIQTAANKQVSSCSYLDPITVDIFALAIAVFLFIEALVSIFKHKKSKVFSQFSRCVRMCIGTSIFVIHILQFLHK